MIRSQLLAVVLTAVLAPCALAQAPATAPRVVVLPYQGLGLEPTALQKLTDALRAQVAAKQWELTDAADIAKQQRAAVMCGEDAECLATVGQRGGARWVLGFGVAQVGASMAVSALLVDATTGRKHLTFLEKLPALPDDPAPLAQRVVDALFKDVPRAAALEPDLPPPPPPVVVQPVEPPHPLRPWAITATAVTGVAGVTGGVLGVMAMQSYAKLPDVPVNERGPADARQRSLNAGADAALGVAVTAAAAATILWVLDARAGATP